MMQGMYTAATGMVAIEDRQNVLANNIANVSTTGFKRLRSAQKGFYSVFAKELQRPFHFDIVAGPGGGASMDETSSDYSTGVVKYTGDPLNVALQGPGFMVVDTPQGERYTRAGAFSIDSNGNLTTPEGYAVQNAEGGAIEARGGRITIGDDGTVRVDGVPRGRVRMIEFQDPHMLTREGYTLYSASEAATKQSTPATDTRVCHESLEMSNVDVPREMIEMTIALRAYAANQKVINAFDETMGQLITQVGTPS